MNCRLCALALSLSLLLTGCTVGTGTSSGEKNTAESLAAVNGLLPLTVETLRGESVPGLDGTADYADAVRYVLHQGFLGETGETFSALTPVTRGEAICALFRLCGGEESTGETGFADVAADDPLASAVRWAAKENISNGWAGSFHPESPLNRAQLALMLRNCAQVLGLSTTERGTLPHYWDGEPGPDMAVALDPGLVWALENGLLPFVVREVRPKFPVNHAQLAQSLTALDALRGEEPVAEEIARNQRAAAEPDAPKVHEKIQAAIDAAAEHYHAVGVQVAVVENGTVSDKFAGGWAVRPGSASYAAAREANQGGVPMTADHKLRVASLSKVVVGMSAMALAEEGVVDLDQSIGAYWDASAQHPQYPDKPVTLRNLMTHTSSLAMLESTAAKGPKVQARLRSGKGFSGAVPGDMTGWGYNNYGFGVLGLTLERASGKVMDQIAGEHFFAPLGMDATFESGRVRDTDHLAAIYSGNEMTRSVEMQKGLTQLGAPGSSGMYFAGGLTTSSADLAKMVAVLANDGNFEGRQVLSPASVSAMETSAGTPPGESFGQCLVIREQEDLYGRKKLHYHTGSAYGVYNLLSYDPETGDGVVVLTTGASAQKDERGIYAICGAISQAVYAALQEVRGPQETEEAVAVSGSVEMQEVGEPEGPAVAVSGDLEIQEALT